MQMNNINISVIIPAYNCEKTIPRTLESILNQKRLPLEIIVVNDGSKDATSKICKQYTNKYKIIKLFDLKTNKGVSNARNIGIQHANGSYVHFIDADDTIDENLYEIAIKTLNNAKVDCLEFGCNFVHKNIVIESRHITQNIYCNNKKQIAEFLKSLTYSDKERVLNVIWNKIYSKKSIIKNNIQFNKEIDLGEDFLFNCSFFEKMNSYIEIKNCLYNYYKNQEGNLTSKFRTDVIKRATTVYEAWTNLYKKYNIYKLKGEDYFAKYEGKLLYYALYTVLSSNCKLSTIGKEKFIQNIITNEHSKYIKYYLKNGIEKKLIEHSNAKALLKYMQMKMYTKSIIKKIIRRRK